MSEKNRQHRPVILAILARELAVHVGLETMWRQKRERGSEIEGEYDNNKKWVCALT